MYTGLEMSWRLVHLHLHATRIFMLVYFLNEYGHGHVLDGDIKFLAEIQFMEIERN